jgi:hypothetical protein
MREPNNEKKERKKNGKSSVQMRQLTQESHDARLHVAYIPRDNFLRHFLHLCSCVIVHRGIFLLRAQKLKTLG